MISPSSRMRRARVTARKKPGLNRAKVSSQRVSTFEGSGVIGSQIIEIIYIFLDIDIIHQKNIYYLYSIV